MTIRVSVCYLIVASILGFLAGVESVQSILSSSVVKDVLKIGRKIDEEINIIRKGLTVYDDDNNLIELTFGDDDEENEDGTNLKMADSVKFHLYTRKNPKVHQELLVNDDVVLTLSNFNPEKPTIFLTHGWVGRGGSSSCVPIRNAYLKKDDVNVIIVDWNKISSMIYIQASRYVALIGHYVAEMINYLKERKMLVPEEITLVGHSLGAHVVGLAGHFTNGTVGYIVGLDPALPTFELAGPGYRISTADANYVEIIHTNGGVMGFFSAIGHVDFFPNGGSLQPGCVGDTSGACSHFRAPAYFAESINSKIGFRGKACNMYTQFISGLCKTNLEAVMGGWPIKIAPTGKYHLTTNSERPFAKEVDG